MAKKYRGIDALVEVGAAGAAEDRQREWNRAGAPPIADAGAKITGALRLAEALGWVRERRLAAEDDLSYLREFEHITLARVLMTRFMGDRTDRSIREAIGLLVRLLTAAQAGGRPGNILEILVVQALAHRGAGSARQRPDSSRAKSPD